MALISYAIMFVCMHASDFHRNSHNNAIFCHRSELVLHSLLHLLKTKCLNYLRLDDEDYYCHEDLHSKGLECFRVKLWFIEDVSR